MTEEKTEEEKPNFSGREGLRETISAIRKKRNIKGKEEKAKTEGEPLQITSTLDVNMTQPQAEALTKIIILIIVKPPLNGMADTHDKLAKQLDPDYTFALSGQEEAQLKLALEACFITIPYHWGLKFIPWVGLIISLGSMGYSRVTMAQQISANWSTIRDQLKQDNANNNNGT